MGNVIDITERLVGKQEQILNNIDEILESYEQVSHENRVEYDKEKSKIDELVRNLEEDLAKEKKRDLIVSLTLTGIAVVICVGLAALANR